MKTILVPVDFSPVTRDVIRVACDLATATSHSLLLVHVLVTPNWFETYGLGPEVVAEVMKGGEKVALARLEELAVECRRHGLEVRTILPSGKPVAVIVDRAAEFDARYIVMGSHGHGAVFELLIGSTAQGVLRRSRCPVFVVPSRVAAAAAPLAATSASA